MNLQPRRLDRIHCLRKWSGDAVVIDDIAADQNISAGDLLPKQLARLGNTEQSLVQEVVDLEFEDDRFAP